jgi:serine protease Do
MEAGLRIGDIVIQFDGRSIKNVAELQAAVAAAPAFRGVAIVLVRDGEKLELRATVGS